jgi:hypothetical protein
VLEAKVLFSLSHGENFPVAFVENLRKEISYECWYSDLNQKTLDKHSCVVIYNPREPFSREEIESLKRYKGGIFVITDFMHPSEYETFKQNDIIKELFNIKLDFRQFVPEISVGIYELVYEKKRIFRLRNDKS